MVNEAHNSSDELIDYLTQFVSVDRLSKIDRVLDQRTRQLTVVLEDLYQPHNASAVLRSCECFGIQDVHIIESNYQFKPSIDVALGSQQWLSLHNYSNKDQTSPKEACVKALKDKGYQIVITTLSGGSQPIQDLDITSKTALCFGTEKDGISPELEKLADKRMHIPMHGFTQSFNISVSAALSLSMLQEKVRSQVPNWQLDSSEKTDLKIKWIIQSIRQGQMIADAFLKSKETSK